MAGKNTGPAKADAMAQGKRKPGFLVYLRKNIFLYILALPGVVAALVFSYAPMYGLLLAFKDFNFKSGILGSPWTSHFGFGHFIKLFSMDKFWQVTRNTVLINLYGILLGFTFTIFLALMLNEFRMRRLRKAVQTAVYLPYFLSWVVFAGLIKMFLDPQTGMANNLISLLTGVRYDESLLINNSLIRFIIVLTETIKNAGYDSILYLAAIAGVNTELYESAKVDGANRFHMMKYITLPRIYPTIAVLLLMRLSRIFVSNFEQVFNLITPMTYENGDVISTYIYRLGMEQAQYERSTAVGLITNLLGVIILIIVNRIITKREIEGVF